MKEQAPKMKKFTLDDFREGLVTDAPATALPEKAVRDIMNLRYIPTTKYEPKTQAYERRVILAPRYGASIISNTALTKDRVIKSAIYVPFSSGSAPCYVACAFESPDIYTLWYYDADGDPQLIGFLDGEATFTIFNDKLIISDSGVTSYWDGTTYAELDNVYVDQAIETGDGAEDEFTGTFLNPPVDVSSITITYTSGGVTKTITDDGAGALIGDVVADTNTIIYATGVYSFKCSDIPDNATSILATYTTKAPISTLCLVRPDRLWLIGDTDDRDKIWYSGSIAYSNCVNTWNSQGIFASGGTSENYGGGYERVAPEDGADLNTFCMFFNRMFMYKNQDYYRSRFDQYGVIDSAISAEGEGGIQGAHYSIGCSLLRGVKTAADTMLVVTPHGLIDIKAVEASFGDLAKANVSAGKVNTKMIDDYSATAYCDYNPVDNELWIQFDDNNYILIYDNELKTFGKYHFMFDETSFNWCPWSGRMLIGGTDGHLYYYDRATYKDNDVQFIPYVETAYTSFNLDLYMKDALEWVVLGECDYGLKFDIDMYWDEAYSSPYNFEISSPWSEFITVDDLTDMQVNDLDFFTFDDKPERDKHYHNLFFQKLMIKITFTGFLHTDAYFKGIKFLGEVLPI